MSFNSNLATEIEYNNRQFGSTSSDGSQYQLQTPPGVPSPGVPYGQHGGTPMERDLPPSFQRPNYGPTSPVYSPRTPEQIAATFVTGSTPGVVGAQEVYRDPRDRIAAQRGGLAPKNPPGSAERMSFRDKMKMFAHEAGEHTPQEKPKISSAQRTIETGIIAR